MLRNRSRRHQCANKRLPEGLHNLLVEELLLLPPSPKVDHLKSELLKKFVSSDTDPANVTKRRAIEKWLATEQRNAETNDRLLLTDPDFQILRDVPYHMFLEKCRSVVSDIIGDTVPEICLIGKFSGGATTSRNRTVGHPALKYLGKAHVTEEASSFARDLAFVSPLWAAEREQSGSRLEVVSGNEMFTVPKTSTIDRVACKEPDLNMFFQRGAGDEIRRCLKRIGIDLNDQSINSDLARIGSIDGSLATVDLSSASDSVTKMLVFELLPVHWYGHLDSLRSHRTLIAHALEDDGTPCMWSGTWHDNQMFSSMGNGFTFELESLLFYSIARTVAYFTGTRGRISVYGDDIIIPKSMFHDLEWVFRYFGFSVNTDKSFFEGSFRESCGGHFISGLDVTPFYLKGPIETLSDLILFVNSLRRWSVDPLGFCDDDVFPLWEFAASFIPNKFWGANTYGDRYAVWGRPRTSRPVRLSPIRREKDNGLGGYLHWLNATVHRKAQTDLSSFEFRSIEERTFKLERQRCTVNLDYPEFYKELGNAE